MCYLVSDFTLFYIIFENISTNVRKFRIPCYIWHLWRRVGLFLCCHLLHLIIYLSFIKLQVMALYWVFIFTCHLDLWFSETRLPAIVTFTVPLRCKPNYIVTFTVPLRWKPNYIVTYTVSLGCKPKLYSYAYILFGVQT